MWLHKTGNAPYNREEYLVKQIKDNLKTLSFIEHRSLHSYDQINGLYKTAYSAYNKVLVEVFRLDKEVSRLEGLLSLSEKIDALEAGLFGERAEYEDIISDKALLAMYRKQLEKSGAGTPEGTEKINKDIESLQKRVEALKSQMAKCRAEIAGYEQCVRTLDRIDRKNGKCDDKAMREYSRIKAHGRYIKKSYTESPSRERQKGYER